MFTETIKFEKINGRWVIPIDAFGDCDTRYHAPYLARLSETGEMEWQPKEYLGYGRNRTVYYVVENLRSGDYIQAAGGSRKAKDPAKCRVVDIWFDGEPGMTVEYLGDKEWGNLVAERKKNAIPQAETPTIAGQKTAWRDGVLMLYDPDAKTTHFLTALRAEDVPLEERAGFRAILLEEAAKLETVAAAYRMLADSLTEGEGGATDA